MSLNWTLSCSNINFYLFIYFSVAATLAGVAIHFLLFIGLVFNIHNFCLVTVFIPACLSFVRFRHSFSFLFFFILFNFHIWLSFFLSFFLSSVTHLLFFFFLSFFSSVNFQCSCTCLFYLFIVLFCRYLFSTNSTLILKFHFLSFFLSNFILFLLFLSLSLSSFLVHFFFCFSVFHFYRFYSFLSFFLSFLKISFIFFFFISVFLFFYKFRSFFFLSLFLSCNFNVFFSISLFLFYKFHYFFHISFFLSFFLSFLFLFFYFSFFFLSTSICSLSFFSFYSCIYQYKATDRPIYLCHKRLKTFHKDTYVKIFIALKMITVGFINNQVELCWQESFHSVIEYKFLFHANVFHPSSSSKKKKKKWKKKKRKRKKKKSMNHKLPCISFLVRKVFLLWLVLSFTRLLFLLRCGIKLYEWGTHWDSNSPVKVYG